MFNVKLCGILRTRKPFPTFFYLFCSDKMFHKSADVKRCSIVLFSFSHILCMLELRLSLTLFVLAVFPLFHRKFPRNGFISNHFPPTYGRYLPQHRHLIFLLLSFLSLSSLVPLLLLLLPPSRRRPCLFIDDADPECMEEMTQ